MSNLRREGIVQPRSFVPSNSKPAKAKVEVPTCSKGKFETQPKCICDVKWFRCQGHGYYTSECLNKRIRKIRDTGDIEYEKDKSDYEGMLPLESLVIFFISI